MDYIELLKHAFKITIKNKFLWIFGFFAGASAFGSGFNFGGGSNRNGQIQNLNLTKDQIANFLNQHFATILSIGFILIIVCIIFSIISLVAQGAIIGGAEKLIKKEKSDFYKALKIGTKHFWRVWGLNIIYSLIILASIIVLGLPVALFITAHMISLSVFWGLIASLIFLLIVIALNIIIPYSYRIMVLDDKKITQSIHSAIEFTQKHIKEVILVYVSLAVVGIICGIILTLGILFLGGILALLGIAVFAVSNAIGMVYASLAGSAFLIFLFVVSAAYSAFQSVVITQAYEELKGKA